MGLQISEKFLPATLTAPPMTDQEFAALCAEHPDLSLELSPSGELIVMPANYNLTAIRNNRIGRQLDEWAENDGRGLAADSSCGFALPNGAYRSPDASWTLNSRLPELSRESLQGFWHLTPDFVIQLRSHSDRLPVLRAKMLEWIANGTRLAWLIDPDRRAVEIYRPSREPEILDNPSTIQGEGDLASFTLRLRRIWNPLEPWPLAHRRHRRISPHAPKRDHQPMIPNRNRP